MNEPQRLADGGGGDALRGMVGAAQRDVLDDEALARLRARLAVAGAGVALVSVRAGAATKSVTGWKLAALAFVASTAVGAGYATLRSAPAPMPAPLNAPTPARAASAVVSVPVSSSVSAASADVAPPPKLVRVETTPNVRTPAPIAREPTPTALTTQRAAPAVSSPREGVLLLQARRALPTDPARALALVRQHAADFPDSQLAPERDKLGREAEANLAK